MEMFSLIATIKKLGQQSSLLLFSKSTKSLIRNWGKWLLGSSFIDFLDTSRVIFVCMYISIEWKGDLMLYEKSCCITGLLDKDVSSFVHFLVYPFAYPLSGSWV